MSTILPMVQPGPASGDAPPFGRIAIVGLGLMGGSFALAVRQRWGGGLLIGIDRKDVVERAMRLHAVDVAADDLVMAAGAELIVLAAPVRQNIAILAELADHVPGEAVVTDLGSTKVATVAAARQLPSRLAFVGGHPLAGAAAGGIEAARADLFAGRPWLLTPDGESRDAARLDALVSGIGAVPCRVTAVEHDRLVAHISHLPQLAVTALMRVVGQQVGESGLALSGRGLADTVRLASSPAPVWQDICATNASEIERALDALISHLQELRAGLRDDDVINRAFAAANHWKGLMPRREDR
jgi:prephenate dehydrogenase